MPDIAAIRRPSACGSIPFFGSCSPSAKFQRAVDGRAARRDSRPAFGAAETQADNALSLVLVAPWHTHCAPDGNHDQGRHTGNRTYIPSNRLACEMAVCRVKHQNRQNYRTYRHHSERRATYLHLSTPQVKSYRLAVTIIKRKLSGCSKPPFWRELWRGPREHDTDPRPFAAHSWERGQSRFC